MGSSDATLRKELEAESLESLCMEYCSNDWVMADGNLRDDIHERLSVRNDLILEQMRLRDTGAVDTSSSRESD